MPVNRIFLAKIKGEIKGVTQTIRLLLIACCGKINTTRWFNQNVL